MINGYGIFFICWIFAGFVFRCATAHKEERPTVSILAYATKFTLMVWLIFQI